MTNDRVAEAVKPMNNDGAVFGIGIFFGASVAFVMCALLHYGEKEAWHDEAIKRGFAEYNQTTGAWQWKQLTTEKP